MVLTSKNFFLMFAVLTSFGCQHLTQRTTAGENPADLSQKIICPSKTRREITNYTPPPDGLVKVAFFDADSTLRIAPSGSVSANTPTDVRILPNVPKVLKMLKDKGYLIYIVSNQNGVEAGHVTCDTAEGALLYTISEITEAGGAVNGYDFAEISDESRKPGTGMALALEDSLRRSFGQNVRIDKAQSFMVGDSAFKKADKKGPADARMDLAKSTIVPGQHFSNADRLFAQNYGVYFYEPTDFFGWRKYGIDVLATSQDVDQFLQKCKDCQ